MDVDTVFEEFQMELVELQCGMIIKQKCAEVDVSDFYEFLPSEAFQKLFPSSLYIMAMFRSTYVCAQFFSAMDISESALHSKMYEHLHSMLRLVNLQDLNQDRIPSCCKMLLKIVFNMNSLG